MESDKDIKYNKNKLDARPGADSGLLYDFDEGELLQPPEVSEPSQPEIRDVAVVTTAAYTFDSFERLLGHLSPPVPQITGIFHVRLPPQLRPCPVSASPLAALWTALPQQRAGEGETEL